MHVQVHVCAHVCARSQEDREIHHLNLASPGDESKAKRSSGLNHTTTGRRGSLALHDYLRAACSRTGWQAGGGEQPVSGESFVVSRPLGPAVAAPGAGDTECSSEEPLPVPGAGRWGRMGLASGSGFPVLQKSRDQAREKPRHFLA